MQTEQIIPCPDFFSSFHQPVLMLDAAHQLLYINPAFDQQCAGTDMMNLIPQLLFPAQEVRIVNMLLSEGKVVPMKAASVSIKLSDGQIGMVYTFTPILSDSLDAELEQMKLEAARSKEELEQILYVTSHDLQAPLRTVGSYIQLIEKSIEKGNTQSVGEFMKFVLEGVATMQTLIQNLLEYSRITTKGQTFSEVNMNQAWKAAQAQLMKKIVETNAELSADELPTVKGDGTQLTKVFQQLLDNALKFIPSGSKPVIRLSVKERENDYIFSFADNGIGLEQKFYQRIFVIFQRLHPKEAYPGTGIGLAVCKKIVERHGGEMWVESEPDKGSVFYFRLNK